MNQMSSEDNNKNRRNRYKKIDQDKRLEIIQRINNGDSLKTVAEETGINISTCKAILKVYNEEGRVGKKKTRNKIVEVIQTYSFYCLDNSSLTQLCPMKIQTGKVSVGQDEDIDDLLKQKCKEKGEKILKQTMQTRDQVNNAVQQVNPVRQQVSQQASVSSKIEFPLNFYPYPMFYQ